MNAYQTARAKAARESAAGQTNGIVMSFSAAWDFVQTTNPADHHERCSWRATNGALLCDCDVIWNEYERRKTSHPAPGADHAEQ